MKESEIYVSIDIETDGSIPGDNSMLSLGAAAFDGSGKIISEWYEKFLPLSGATPDPETMKWWEGFPDAYKEATSNAGPPDEAIRDFVTWCRELPGKPVLCANPGAWDGMFVTWYAVHFGYSLNDLPWKHRILDMRTAAMIICRLPYHKAHGDKVFRIAGGAS